MTGEVVRKAENPWLNLLFNLVLPFLIWSQLSSLDRLGPALALILGLAFPITYALWDWIKYKRRNLISFLGIVSLLLTGTLALVQVNLFWFAVKEAAIPLVIAIFTVVSVKTQTPMVETFLFNDKIFQIEKINQIIEEHQQQSKFDRILVHTNYMIAASFLLSAVINFALARLILKSPPGTEAFTQELANMNLLSFGFITLPCMVVLALGMYYLLSNLKKMTNLKMDELMRDQGSKA